MPIDPMTETRCNRELVEIQIVHGVEASLTKSNTTTSLWVQHKKEITFATIMIDYVASVVGGQLSWTQANTSL